MTFLLNLKGDISIYLQQYHPTPVVIPEGVIGSLTTLDPGISWIQHLVLLFFDITPDPR